jgi:hypothetical protein
VNSPDNELLDEELWEASVVVVSRAVLDEVEERVDSGSYERVLRLDRKEFPEGAGTAVCTGFAVCTEAEEDAVEDADCIAELDPKDVEEAEEDAVNDPILEILDVELSVCFVEAEFA